MEPCSLMYRIHGRQQVRSAAGSNDDPGGVSVAGARPVVSALAVPGDPLDGIMQCLGGEDDCWVTGAWFDDFRGGSMDMSTHAGVDFLEMLLDVPDTTSALAAEATRAEAVPVPDRRPAVTTNRPPSSFSSGDDEDEDDTPWMSSGDSSSEEDAGDDHWLPRESRKSSGGTKRRLCPRVSTSGGESRQETQQTVARPAPGGVEAAVEGEGGGDGRLFRCLDCNTSTTPLWRGGPEGPKTLCNACGLRYSKQGAPTTAKRLSPAKPSICSGKSINYPVVPLPFAGGATVVRKKRSVALRIG